MVTTPSTEAPRPGTPIDPDAARAAVAGLSRSFAAGDYPQAETHARLLLGLVPADPNLRRILAAAELAQGRVPAALTNLRRALVVGPDYLEARYNLANTLAETRETDQAVGQYRRALKLAPDHADSLVNLGTLHATAERRDLARACFRRAAIFHPDSGLAIRNLGVLALGEGAFEPAIRHFAWAHRVAPSAVETNLNLANALREAGRVAPSITFYRRALALAPQSAGVLAGATRALLRLDGRAAGDWNEAARALLIACLRSPGVESNSLNRISEPLIRLDLELWFNEESQRAAPGGLPDMPGASRDPITAHLMDSLISDPDLEATFVTLRRRLLEAWRGSRELPAGYPSLIRALGLQGMMNEYLWPITGEEERMLDALLAEVIGGVEAGEDPDAVALYLLSAYRALTPIEPLRRWATVRRAHVEAELGEDLDILILDRVREQEIAASIPDLTSIDDAVSTLVRAQYEDNPYPRWNSLARHEPIDPFAQILAEIAPNSPSLAPLPERPQVLIAGCGTGRQAAQAAMAYRGASILAIDLSLPSLAHAERKCAELGIDSIRFARADILALPTLSERFDIIECCGVLHHMADPGAGLEALLGVLAPGGLMKIALYSAAARANVTRLRAWIAERGYPATLEGIRRFRADLAVSGHPDAEATRRSIDYNATSAIRDLLFHAQEHQFTIPGLERLLDDHELEFLGFLFLDPTVKAAYRERFPADPSCIDLSNWAAFEADHPLTFVSMYQFWCRRRG